jgi:hypothetical protein
MSKAVVVRYTTSPASADENQRLVENVYAELAKNDPGGLRYATFRLADGVSFVHIAIVEGEKNPLEQTAAFREFVREIGKRAIEPPVSSDAELIGSYRFVEP